MKKIYVTFQIRPNNYFRLMGYQTKHYAIKCDNLDNALEAAADVYSLCGVSHIRINKCGRLRHKDTKVILYGSFYGGEL